MVLKFHEDYRLALPVLKVGHVIKAGAGSKGGSGFWVVEKVMEGRALINESAIVTKKKWIASSGDAYKQVSGNLDTERIVHLQYLGALDTNDALLYWMKDPLFSPEVDSTVNSTIAPDTNPLRLDKWSYDQSMFMAVTAAAAVNHQFIVETVNYLVDPLKGKPPQKYLEITVEGNATFVELPRDKPGPGPTQKKEKVFLASD